MVLIDANAILRHVLHDNFEMARSVKYLLKNKRVHGYDAFTFDKKLNTLLQSQIMEG